MASLFAFRPVVLLLIIPTLILYFGRLFVERILCLCVASCLSVLQRLLCSLSLLIHVACLTGDLLCTGLDLTIPYAPTLLTAVSITWNGLRKHEESESERTRVHGRSFQRERHEPKCSVVSHTVGRTIMVTR